MTKREKRLEAALVRIRAAANEMYPDTGNNSQRQRAHIKRESFTRGALWWRYLEAVDSADASRALCDKEAEK